MRYVFLLLVGVFLLAPTPVLGQSELPKPTGKYGIGRTVLHWSDPSRPEPQAAKPGTHRELLVYLCYPIDNETTGVRAEYFPHLKEVEAFEEQFGKNFFRKSYGESYKTISTIRSNAIENAQPAPGSERFPVLIFSHGGGIPVLCYTAIIEHLVSHGYVVAAVEHPFDGATVVFPDGHIITQNGWDEDPKRTKEEQTAFHLARYRVNAKDNRCVLDQLERANSSGMACFPAKLQGRLNTSLVGAIGHSLGGKVAAYSGQDDARFRICLNLDGGLESGLNYGTLTQTNVAMYGDNRKPQQPGEPANTFAKRKSSRDRFVTGLMAPYADAAKGSYLLLVDSPAFSHFSYYDFPNEQCEQPPWRATPDQWKHNQRIILDFSLAVIDSQLRPREAKPVDDLLKRYPEVIREPVGASKDRP